jgi:hypothetical protein
VPAANAPRRPLQGLEVTPLNHISEALEELFRPAKK